MDRVTCRAVCDRLKDQRAVNRSSCEQLTVSQPYLGGPNDRHNSGQIWPASFWIISLCGKRIPRTPAQPNPRARGKRARRSSNCRQVRRDSKYPTYYEAYWRAGQPRLRGIWATKKGVPLGSRAPQKPTVEMNREDGGLTWECGLPFTPTTWREERLTLKVINKVQTIRPHHLRLPLNPPRQRPSTKVSWLPAGGICEPSERKCFKS